MAVFKQQYIFFFFNLTENACTNNRTAEQVSSRKNGQTNCGKQDSRRSFPGIHAAVRTKGM